MSVSRVAVTALAATLLCFFLPTAAAGHDDSLRALAARLYDENLQPKPAYFAVREDLAA